eukprot:CAMPEP_0202453548 /NCGR_PEP_ID=MMETSP1360-20130828/11502_1 /ASSEMBLY_ACC=CAM_ASM_000848 /TAXON_ID=515479 /ORGANISM="Licmophora paradoxa, Strain CCMP2313" /LENGTH=64 /DNA_ID=CAMNT_0049072677 /DNA_START=54 /DNA_END=244 /DNA_ORIENTATION=+
MTDDNTAEEASIINKIVGVVNLLFDAEEASVGAEVVVVEAGATVVVVLTGAGVVVVVLTGAGVV